MTCCTPGAPCGRPSMPSTTSAGPSPCSWPSWSTGGTASCRSAPTTWARTCRPRSRRWSASCSPRPTARTRCSSNRSATPHGRAAAASPGGNDEPPSHLSRRPEQAGRAPGAGHRRGTRPGGGPAHQEAAHAARADRRQPLLRRLHQDPDLLRGGRQAAVRRRDQLRRQGLERGQGGEPQGHRADPRGHGRRRGRRPAQRLRRAAPAGGLGPGQRDQRRRRCPRAPDPGAAGRLHDPAQVRPRQRRGAGRAAGHDRRRRAAQPGGPVQRPAAAPARRGRRAGRAAHPAADSDRRLAVLGQLRPRRGAAQERRGDDAADPAGTDERRLLPQRARVQPALRAGHRPAPPASRRGHRDAPRPDEPGGGDRRRGRRLAAVHDRRAGRQRGQRPDGRPVSAARRAGGGPMTATGWVIKGARPLGAEPADITITDGTITAIGDGPGQQGAQVLDASGLIALPGLVDLHTHLREPGREDAETIETGTLAAALGGFTAVHAMANTDPVADTAGVTEQIWRLGRAAGHCDVQPVGAVTVGLAGSRLAEFGAMAESAARVRVFSDDGSCVADAVLMRRALEYVKAFDGVIAQHAQEPRLTEGAQMNEGAASGRLGLAGWPAVAEEAIIARDCLLAAHVGSALHICHVSTAGSVEIIRWAKSKNWRVTAEVTPHHLLLTDDLVASYDPVYKVNPPLRTAADVAALRQALADGTIDCVATDHAPHPVEDKETEWAVAAPGMTGLETALRVVQETMVEAGLLGWAQVADRMSARPAAIGRLAGHGRPLEAGSPASLVLYDPAARGEVDPAQHASRSRNSPFAGMSLPGRVVATFLRGEPTVLDGKLAR